MEIFAVIGDSIEARWYLLRGHVDVTYCNIGTTTTAILCVLPRLAPGVAHVRSDADRDYRDDSEDVHDANQVAFFVSQVLAGNYIALLL